MPTFRDFEGRPIRLTEERRKHILSHREMSGLDASIGEVLRTPGTVVQSRSDPEARLYYRYYLETAVGSKFLCVVTKITDRDAYVVTAYLTDRVKRGRQIWSSES